MADKRPTLYKRTMEAAGDAGFVFNPAGQLVVKAADGDAHEPAIILATAIALQEREAITGVLKARQARFVASGDLSAARAVGGCLAAIEWGIKKGTI